MEVRDQARMRSPARLLAFGVAALGLGLALAVIIFEVSLRVFDLAPTSGVGTVDADGYARIPGLFTPGQDLIDRQKPALPHRVHINALGYRGAEISLNRSEGEFRVPLVGDSFTFRDFVDDAETLPAQLEGALEGVPLGRGCDTIRVINAGVGGTTIVTHAEMARRGLEVAPDLVVLIFSENDVTDLQNPMWHSLAANRRSKSRFPLSIAYPVLRQTATWNFLLKVHATLRVRLREAAATATAEEGVVDSGPDRLASTVPSRRLQDRERYRFALVSLHEELADRGVPLLFVIYPGHHALAAQGDQKRVRWAESMARGEGLPVVSLLGPIVDSGLSESDLYLLPHDGHPSPTGYRIAAEFLARAVSRIAMASKRCGTAGRGGGPAIPDPL